MKTLAMILGLSIGCVDSDSVDADHPVLPAGGGNPGVSGGDIIVGRVCIATDVLDPTICVRSGAGGLVVVLGDEVATTAADGSFSIARSAEATTITVSGERVVTTTSSVQPTALVPVVDADRFARQLSSLGVLLPDRTGSIAGTVVTTTGSPTGVGVTSVPASSSGPFFDGGGGTTGVRGVFFVPGVIVGSTDLRFRDTTGRETLVNGVSVINGGITILDSVPLP